jgi:hypothetical protein
MDSCSIRAVYGEDQTWAESSRELTNACKAHIVLGNWRCEHWRLRNMTA